MARKFHTPIQFLNNVTVQNSDGTRDIRWGSGSPESVVTAPVGSVYIRTNGATKTTLYVKESGTGNTGWSAFGPATSDERALTMGVSGTISATMTDAADFLVVVPFNMTLKRIKCSAKTAPSGSMSIQIRRSTNSGASFSDAFGTCTFSASSKVATADPADLAVNEGDVLNFSVSTGSGSNLLVELIASA